MNRIEEIWEEVARLTTIEKLQLIEYIARSIREEIEKETKIDKAN